jgi:gluconolactonase
VSGPGALSTILETTQAERLATGFVFTEGPLWHPDGFYYFVDIRQSRLHRLTPGKPVELVRDQTGEGNGTTFDLQGRLVICEGGNRRVTRWSADGRSEVLMDRWEGKRLNRPNDDVCRSDGSIRFTDPGQRVPLPERELPSAGVYRVAPDGTTSLVADCEYPNGLAFSPTSARSTWPTRAGRSTSTPSSSTRPAMSCVDGSSPTCPPTRPTVSPTG